MFIMDIGMLLLAGLIKQMHEIVGVPGLEYPNYDGLEVLSYQDTGPIYKFKNLKTGSGTKRFLSGEWMVIANPYYYGHYLQENLGPLLLYRKYINSNIKVIWINQETPENAHDSNTFKKIGEEASKLFSFDGDEFISLNDFFNTEITFENLVTFFYGSRFVPGLNINNYIFKDLYQHNNALINKELRNAYLNKIEKNKSLPKKIFLSRKKRSKLIEKFNNGEDPLRHAPSFYHDAIEDFFKTQGYEILEMSGKTVVEQASYVNNATHIAGISGTAFLNGIFAEKDTKFYLIKSEPNYAYQHELDSYSVSNEDFLFIEMYNKDNYDQVYSDISKKMLEVL